MRQGAAPGAEGSRSVSKPAMDHREGDSSSAVAIVGGAIAEGKVTPRGGLTVEVRHVDGDDADCAPAFPNLDVSLDDNSEDDDI